MVPMQVCLNVEAFQKPDVQLAGNGLLSPALSSRGGEGEARAFKGFMVPMRGCGALRLPKKCGDFTNRPLMP